MAATPDLLVRRLSKADDRSQFRCGDADLDRFFHRYAGQNQFRHHNGTTFVAVRAGTARAFRVPGRRGGRQASGGGFLPRPWLHAAGGRTRTAWRPTRAAAHVPVRAVHRVRRRGLGSALVCLGGSRRGGKPRSFRTCRGNAGPVSWRR